VLAAAWPADSPVTVLSVNAGAEGGAVRTVLDVLGDRAADHRDLEAEKVSEGILAEANLGYGAIALGASDVQEAGHLLSPVLDELLMRSPLPLVIVRKARKLGRRLPPAFAKVLVPVTGSPSSRAGQEVACNMALSLGSRVIVAHVVTRTDSSPGGLVASLDGARPDGETAPRDLGVSQGAAQVVLRGAWDMAMEVGVEPEVVVRHGRSPGDELLATAAATQSDIVVVGTSVRHVDGRPFLGHTVEQILTQCDATVVVVALPEQTSRIASAMAEAAGAA
jgi:nucleotide-binding universal stress UspA family protein